MEEKLKTGWIKLYRCTRDSYLWEDKPFSRGQAFIDLLLMVNHKDRGIWENGELIKIEAGQRITSLRQLGENWGWSLTKVKKFLEVLKRENKINFESTTKRTLITVVNWGFYQLEENTERTQKENKNNTEVTQKENRSKTEVKQKETNKNEKNEKNEDNEDNEEKATPPHTKEGKEKIIPYGDLIKNIVSEVAFKTWFVTSDIKERDNKLIIQHNEFSIEVIKKNYLEALQKDIKIPIVLETKEEYKSEVI